MRRLAFALGLGIGRRGMSGALSALACHLPVSGQSSARSTMALTASSGQRGLAAKRTVGPNVPAEFPQLKGDVSFVKPDEANGPPGYHVDADGKVYLKSMTLPELEHWVETELGDKPYRARQLWKWLFKPSHGWASSFDEMTDLAKSFRAKLADVARIDSLSIDTVQKSTDGTRKILFRLQSGNVIESVLIPTEGRNTLCVSSQAGCSLAYVSLFSLG
jgi:hypothetical protein